MGLTSRGWSVFGAAAGLYVAGRVLGAVELSMLAAGGLAALGVAAVLVQVRRPTVAVHRTIHPFRLHAGAPGRAEIALVNRGRRPTPLLAVTDAFSGRREARFGVPPVAPGDTARAAYRVPTTRRGVFAVGPLTVAVTDALGLVRRPVSSTQVGEVTVFPRVEAVTALPVSAGRDLVGGAVVGYARARAGEEFHGLREYEVGDDLRRVHWRSTARVGRLMIREDDAPWQARAAVLLDTRARTHTEASFEAAVEAAASVATALYRAHALVRLLTTGGLDTGYGSGRDQYHAVMERLAAVEAATDDRFGAVAARLHRQAGAGALVAVVGNPPAEDLLALGTLRRRFGLVTVVRIARGPHTRAPGAGAHPGVVLVDVAEDQTFADAWNRGLRLRSSR